jgi:hypothetical protein
MHWYGSELLDNAPAVERYVETNSFKKHRENEEQ